MIAANVNSQITFDSVSTNFEISNKVNNDKNSYTVTIPSKKCKNEINLENMNNSSIVVLKSMNVTPHVKVNYRGNQQSPSDVYLSGNDHIGKLKANFLNDHPQQLIEYLQKENIFDNQLTKNQLR